MATIVVTDGDERASLAVVRSLGAAGHSVVVGSSSGRSIAGASRHAHLEEHWPDPLQAPAEFLRAVSRCCTEHRADLLLPITEAALRVVLPHRSELEPVGVPFPTDEAFRTASDKRLVLSMARELGIAEPTLAVAESYDDLRRLVEELEDQEYPVVLKPERSVVESEGGARKTSVRYAASATELEAIASSPGQGDFPLIVQRKIEGPGIGVFLLVWDGEVMASFAHRRIREKPPSGGVSVLRESIAVPRELLVDSSKLLARLEWSGVAMVEYKLDLSSGTYFLMEINGRFWGSLQLAIDAGVDFPRLLVELARGNRPQAPKDYRVGVRTRWLMGDVDHLAARMLKSRSELTLGADAPGRVRVAWDFVRAFLPPVRAEVFRWSDPGPAVREAASWLRTSVAGRNGR